MAKSYIELNVGLISKRIRNDYVPALQCEVPIETRGKSFVTFVYQKLLYRLQEKILEWEIASDNNKSSYIVNRKCPLYYSQFFL